MFLCKTSNSIVLLLVYVDDIVIPGTDFVFISHLQHLQASFHTKDLSSLTYLLGLEVYIDSSSIFLHLRKYTQELLHLASLQDTSVDTPLDVNIKYRREEGNLIFDPTIFQQLVRGLNYLIITHSDISFAIQQANQFMQNPWHLHLAVVLQIIRYLRGMLCWGLFFPAGSPCL